MAETFEGLKWGEDKNKWAAIVSQYPAIWYSVCRLHIAYIPDPPPPDREIWSFLFMECQPTEKREKNTTRKKCIDEECIIGR